MGSYTIRLFLATVVTVALYGCSAGNGSPSAPGSVTVHLHGRAEATIGASSR